MKPAGGTDIYIYIYIYPQIATQTPTWIRRLSRYVDLRCKLCGRFVCAASRFQSRRTRGSPGVSWAGSRGPPALGGVQGASGLGPEVALPFQDGVLGSPGLGPGGCHTGTWTAEVPGKRGSMMSLWMWSEGPGMTAGIQPAGMAVFGCFGPLGGCFAWARSGGPEGVHRAG